MCWLTAYAACATSMIVEFALPRVAVTDFQRAWAEPSLSCRHSCSHWCVFRLYAHSEGACFRCEDQLALGHGP